MLTWLDERGVKVFDAVTHQVIELKTPEGMMLNGIRCLWAQIERMRIGQRTKRVFNYCRDTGQPWHGRPRYGFIRVRTMEGEKVRTRWVRNEREWQLMAEIYRLHAEQRLSFRKITALFAERGEVTDDSVRHGAKSKGRWDYGRVFRAFHFYKRAMEAGEVVQ